jgi:hypothetical protein
MNGTNENGLIWFNLQGNFQKASMEEMEEMAIYLFLLTGTRLDLCLLEIMRAPESKE